MTKISIIRSSSDIDNEELLPVSWSSSLKVFSLSDSDNEEEDNIGTEDQESNDSYILESLSSLVSSLWKKRKLHINIDFAVTGLMWCVIPHIHKYAKDHTYSAHKEQVNNVTKTLFRGLSIE